MKKAKYSSKDSRGMLCVDCSECERGGNGSDKDKCSCGWKVKKGKNGSCFAGTLMAGLEVWIMSEERKSTIVYTIELRGNDGKILHDLTQKYQLFPAVKFAKRWIPGGKNVFPVPTSKSDERLEFWEARYRLTLNGKWYRPGKETYHLFTMEEFFHLLLMKSVGDNEFCKI